MKKQFKRAFIEITNICNLSCEFCVTSSQPKAFMPPETFESIAAQVKLFTDTVSLHVLGEPFMHPQLPEILSICSRQKLDISLVTNGTLIDKFGPDIFKEKCLKQISFSLHSLQAFPKKERLEKLNRLIEFTKTRPSNIIISFRLRGNPKSSFLQETYDYILNAFPDKIITKYKDGLRLQTKTFLNFELFFKWPGQGGKRDKKGCQGLQHHFAVLCSGETVPCCLDYDGKLSIGNINNTPLKDILNSPSAIKLKNSIAGKTPIPDYCATCGFIAPGTPKEI
ncbi:MAG: SPASM domain-containing protein [Elusimicrobiales bacterium]|nr:SPASM domain-containing protein [Elusimicrobiales bacterium]